mmetsp:Transcript_3110/g.12452  ORF Transcript_3110/g.12452 Transcript_3110/m.12452 type:complete len:316 (-) Transcript_3110:1547-2494(-)
MRFASHWYSVTCSMPSSKPGVLKIQPNGFTSITVASTTAPIASGVAIAPTRSTARSSAFLFGAKMPTLPLGATKEATKETPATTFSGTEGTEGWSTLMVAPVDVWISLMVLPPVPINLPINDASMSIAANRGAFSGISPRSSLRARGIAASIASITFPRARFATPRASFKISSGIPAGLQSSWIPVTPPRVPAILKSMSPSTSSRPMMSASSACFVTLPVASSVSVTSPTEMAPTCSPMGTPASMSAMDPAHTAAIELEPLLSMVSALSRTANGHASEPGNAAASAFSAKAPCPISRRLSPPLLGVSSMEKDGNA